jgi:hypothetical protein
MKLNILLLAVFAILLYTSSSVRVFLNEPLGKVVFFIICLYFFYQSPVLGVIAVLLTLLFKQYSYKDNNIPLAISYKTNIQTPVTPISELVPHESGLELLHKEEDLRAKESNRHSIVKGSPQVCNDDTLCLYDNEPQAHQLTIPGEKII